MGVVCDVIFSLIAGLPEVHPNFFGVSDGVLQQYENKFSGALMHTGTPSGPALNGLKIFGGRSQRRGDQGGYKCTGEVKCLLLAILIKVPQH